MGEPDIMHVKACAPLSSGNSMNARETLDGSFGHIGPLGLHLARVLETGSTALRIVREDQEESAQRAFGCLVEPIAGDRVLVARVGGESFVLSVLDRLVGDQAVLSAPGATALTVAADDISLAAGRRLSLSSAKETRLSGETVAVQAGTFSLVGRMMTVVMDHLRSVLRRKEEMADVVALQAGERTTLVRGADVSKVGTLVQEVETVSTSTASTAVIIGREDVRVDAKRVTVG